MFLLTLASCGQASTCERLHILDLLLAPSSLRADGNPFDASFRAVFRGPQGEALAVPGFYDETKGYIARFSPTQVGQWPNPLSGERVAAKEYGNGQLAFRGHWGEGTWSALHLVGPGDIIETA